MAIYLDDLTPGDTASFGSYEVTREDVLAFAAKFDPQPFHLSDEAAAKTLFGRLSASGWHTAAMTMRMIVDNWRDQHLQALAGLGTDELQWLKPVHPGDVLRTEIEVLAITPSKSKPDRGTARLRIITRNQHDETVMTQVSRVLIARRV